MLDFKEYIVDKIKGTGIDLETEKINELIEIPPNDEMGDFAFPCFQLAKVLRKNPALIAEELAENIEKDSMIQNVEVKGAYVNFFLSKEAYFKTVFEEIRSQENFGARNTGEGKNMIVEFSSTNIAKPFHIGHIRSTVIGNAINNILRYENYNTTSINYLGDYGTQFGMMISAYRKWGDRDKINQDPIQELLNLYVKYNKMAKEDDNLMEEARYWFDQLEQKNPEAVELWQWFKEISLEEFKRTYKLLGVEFDSYNGEAFHSQFMEEAIKELEDKNLLEESEGAIIVNLEDENLPPVLVKKSNGSSTYITRDIATAIYRKKEYAFDKNVYVVASQQNLHFQQLKAVLKKMGYSWADDCIHVSFGMISMKDGAMKTREGKVIFLEDVLKKAVDKTLDIINERNPELENKEQVAKDVGVGAVIFQDLFNNRVKDYEFDWDQVLNFDGETGPYVQYTHARSCSILTKGGGDYDKAVREDLLTSEEEVQIAKLLYDFPRVIQDAIEKYEPSFVTRYAVNLSSAFNKFYNACPILSEEKELRDARLFLTYSVNKVLKIALGLIGLQSPQKM